MGLMQEAAFVESYIAIKNISIVNSEAKAFYDILADYSSRLRATKDFSKDNADATDSALRNENYIWRYDINSPVKKRKRRIIIRKIFGRQILLSNLHFELSGVLIHA